MKALSIWFYTPGVMFQPHCKPRIHFQIRQRSTSETIYLYLEVKPETVQRSLEGRGQVQQLLIRLHLVGQAAQCNSHVRKRRRQSCNPSHIMNVWWETKSWKVLQQSPVYSRQHSGTLRFMH